MCCYANKFPDMTIKTHTPLEVMTGSRMDRIRVAMMNGERSIYEPFCERCLVMEKQGQTSRRQKRWDAITDETRAAINATNVDGSLKWTHLEHFDIKFTGNKCNLRCYMCHPFYSSGVALEWKKMGWWNGPRHINPFADLTDSECERWWEGFDQIIPYVRVLNFTGGEPFIMDEYWAILDHVISTGAASKMELHLSSNFTTMEYRGKSVRQYFDKFERVHVQASVDAFGPHYKYIRYPGKYSEVISNLTLAKQWVNVDLQVTAVVSALSVFSLPALHEHMAELRLPFRFDNVLTEPKYMRVSSLPMWAKDRLRHILTHDDFGSIRALLDEPEVPEHWNQLVTHLDGLDRIRGTNWRQEFVLLGENA